MRPIPIPQTPEELGPAWLSGALHEGGWLTRGAVRTVEAEPLGPVEGFTGQSLRLRLDYEPADAGGPGTLIVKLPTAHAHNRASAEMWGLYEREIRFYRELAPGVPLRVPRHYYSAMDPGPSERSRARSQKLVESLPAFSVGLVTPVFRWLASRSRRRYVLLLEDLAPARVGDQVGGCTTERAASALRAVAALHAAFWERQELDALEWLGVSSAPRLRQAIFRRRERRFSALYGDALEAPIPALARWLAEHGLVLHERMAAAPQTLLHGDFRLDNLFFDVRDEDVFVAAVDWQLTRRGRGTADVAYFLMGCLEAEEVAAAEEELLRVYHARLVEHGISAYPFAACWRDYQGSKLLNLQDIILSSDAWDVGDPRGAALAERYTRRLAALLASTELAGLID